MPERSTGDFDYELSLRIWHPSIAPEQLSDELSLAAHAGWAAGSPQPLIDGGTSPRPSTYWTARLTVEEAAPLARSLRRACELLRPHKQFLDEISRTGGRIEFFVGWFSGPNSGEVFSRTLLGEIAQLGADLALDVYGERASATRLDEHEGGT